MDTNVSMHTELSDAGTTGVREFIDQVKDQLQVQDDVISDLFNILDPIMLQISDKVLPQPANDLAIPNDTTSYIASQTRSVRERITLHNERLRSLRMRINL